MLEYEILNIALNICLICNITQFVTVVALIFFHERKQAKEKDL